MTKLSFLAAAVDILRESARPMSAKDILATALDRGLVPTAGRTPEATLTAQLYVQVRDNPEGPLVRLAEPGRTRARRGSVRWAWRAGGN